MSLKLRPVMAAVVASLSLIGSAQAAFQLAGIGTLSGTTDLSGLTGTLENGNAANILGGMGSGLAWAGGSTYLALPDRGPNASSYSGGTAVDNTTSYIARFNTISLNVSVAPSALPSGTAPYTVTPTLNSTTLLWSSTPLTYGSTAGLPSGAPSVNTDGKYYFTGRSDGFAAGLSSNPNNARLDPESIRVSRDGKSVFVSDEYGPYVYQFDRSTGERIRSYALPSEFAVSNQSALGGKVGVAGTEIGGNTSGRVANKGMEGLAISADGKTLYGIMQSPLLQDGGDTSAGKITRLIKIDVDSGAVKEFAVSNNFNGTQYNNSDLVAINDNTLAFLPRDGKGLGDGSNAKFKQVWTIDLSQATDINDITGLTADSATGLFTGKATLTTRQLLDVEALLKSAGYTEAQIPAKLEGLAFGEDVDGYHMLYVANDNDFVSGVAGPNKIFAFRFTDADLAAAGVTGGLQLQAMAAVPEPGSYALTLTALCAIGAAVRRQRVR